MIDYQRIQRIKYNNARQTGKVFNVNRGMYYITYKCNYACSMCFLRRHAKNLQELTLKEIEISFTNNKFESLVLTGGEVFCRNDFLEILECLDCLVPNVMIITNGSKITKDVLNKVTRLHNIQSICFSIDGFPDVHDRLRGSGSFMKILKSIKALVGKMRIIVNIVISPLNVHSLSDLYVFFSAYGVEQITFQFKMEYGRAELDDMPKWINYNNDCIDSDSPSFTYLALFDEQLKKIKTIENNTVAAFRPPMFEKGTKLYTSLNRKAYPELHCTDLLEPRVKILPDGEVTLCEALNLPIGNILNDSISSILNGEKATEFRKKLLNENMNSLCCRCCSISSFQM